MGMLWAFLYNGCHTKGTVLQVKKILLVDDEPNIIELARLAGEPLDIKVGGQTIAQGEVVAVDGYYGLRITNVIVR